MQDTEEIWKDIPNVNGLYQISNWGRIKNGKRKPFRGSKHGTYLRLLINNSDIYFRCYVHRIVAMIFIPNPENKPLVNHKDCDGLNNHFDNLEWSTHAENSIHAVANGRYAKRKPRLYKTYSSDIIQLITELKTQGISNIKIANQIGISRRGVDTVVARLQKQIIIV